MPITPEQCVALLADELSHRSEDTYSDQAMEWYAKVVGIVSAFDRIDAVPLHAMLSDLTRVNGAANSPFAAAHRADTCNRFLAEVRALKIRLQLQTNAFATRQVARGEVHNYFEEIRGIINGASKDLLFIDPYIDADFVTRYLPQVPQGVTIRLLTSERQAASLSASLVLYREQHEIQVEIKSLPDRSLHDRHLVIDGRDVFQSGASFKDGGRNAPTSINQIVDVAAQMIREHELRWSQARLVP